MMFGGSADLVPSYYHPTRGSVGGGGGGGGERGGERGGNSSSLHFENERLRQALRNRDEDLARLQRECTMLADQLRDAEGKMAWQQEQLRKSREALNRRDDDISAMWAEDAKRKESELSQWRRRFESLQPAWDEAERAKIHVHRMLRDLVPSMSNFEKEWMSRSMQQQQQIQRQNPSKPVNNINNNNNNNNNNNHNTSNNNSIDINNPPPPPYSMNRSMEGYRVGTPPMIANSNNNNMKTASPSTVYTRPGSAPLLLPSGSNNNNNIRNAVPSLESLLYEPYQASQRSSQQFFPGKDGQRTPGFGSPASEDGGEQDRYHLGSSLDNERKKTGNDEGPRPPAYPPPFHPLIQQQQQQLSQPPPAAASRPFVPPLPIEKIGIANNNNNNIHML